MAVPVSQQPQEKLLMNMSIDELCINTIRTLSMDAVQKANSGHPGAPMGLAPVAYCLWQRFLRYDPNDPIWPNRDRFVLSNGHASMMLYSLLYLTGVKAVRDETQVLDEPAITMDEIKRFRQLGSKTPGHPEYGLVSGVETTTGPLGQGCGNSVGMAIAERWLAAHFNRPGYELFNYNVYNFCGDGDMMEGVSSEAASLAGHLKLSNLCWIYDNNHITIEGKTSLAFSEDVAERFRAYGWNASDATHVTDANDIDMFASAVNVFLETKDRPTLIIVDSHIGYGAPHRQDTKEAHGEALGEDEVRGAKRFYNWPEDAHFLVPEGVVGHFSDGFGTRGKELHAGWEAMFGRYKKEYASQAKELELMQDRELPEGWDKNLPVFPADAKGLASRDSSGKVLNVLAENIPWLIGGSADLAPSTKTYLTFPGTGDFEAGHYDGRNFHFGIREHGMSAIVNGMSLSRIRAYGATFLIFSDYARPSLRLAALMEIPAIWVFTHDSIGLGEDGPTHQPIEQLAGLRAIPGFLMFRPADANEVTECWKMIMRLQHQPAALSLTRQAIPTFDRNKYAPAAGTAQGGYVLADAPGGKPELILMGTGSEVQLCVGAYEQLTADGRKVRVVSMPCLEIFEKQSAAYRESVLPSAVTARISVEAASPMGWSRFVGPEGKMIAMRSFGASAKGSDAMKHFGFTTDAVVAAARELLAKR